jgi:hypothetical protein
MSLWIRTINAGHQIGIINKNLISYRVHPNQITKNKSNEDINIHMDLDYSFKPDIEKRRVGIFLICLESKIKKLEKYLKKIKKYFVPEFKKYFFILTDNSNIISDKFVNTGLKFEFEFEFDVKQISNIKDNQNNFKFINYFYPKIELVCDIIFYIPLDNLLEKVINKYDISNEITKPFVLIKHGNSNIFGGITHYFLKFANSEIELHKFEIQNDKKIKVLSK